MNLFEINSDYYSHPDYPLENHLGHSAASFEDILHKEAAWFHDLGKLTREFQSYIQSEGKKSFTTHALESALIFLENKKFELTPEIFAAFYAIIKHHGNLEDTEIYFYNKFQDVDDLEDMYPNLDKRLETICQRLGGLQQPDIEAICDLFGQGDFLSENGLTGIQTYFLIKEVFSRLIFSDKYEAIFKRSYTESTVHHWKKYENNLVTLIASKNNEMADLRNRARQEILDKYQANKNKQIFIIEAPTGIGKTFSALHLALIICQSKGKKKLITALPMTSIIDQTYEEYSAVTGESELLKFHHLTRSKVYGFLHEKERQNETKYFSRQENDFLAMSWSSDNIIVTTFNQLFNLFYSNKNRDLIKFWTIRDSVVIVDEVQAVPRILIRDVAETMTFIATNFNVDFILMSATLPEISRFFPKKLIAQLLDNRYFSLDFNNRYSIRVNPDINQYEGLISEVKSCYQKNSSLLCVVNSKKLSLNVFSDLKDDFEIKKETGELFFLNTNFIPKHRVDIIRNVKKRLEDGLKTLLVSTQVVEAGVDLDFDYGIREFAPLYSMIQTAGRINRENREGMNKTAQLLVTDTIGFCPYHAKDLLKNEVLALFHTEIQENNLLSVLKEYFHIAFDRTSKDYLLKPEMDKLNFETVYAKFSDHFMKEIPLITQVFIEAEKGIYNSFFNRIDDIYDKLQDKNLSLNKKMGYKSQLKDEIKKISQYTINVSEKETEDLQSFHILVPIKVCPHQMVQDESKYSLSRGWLGEETLLINF
ncbi:CRISPR-associated endonuclease/helicase Cas3 [Desulfocicer vacuolatum DSM 3385]|uniref:CRISPR-associated endonuclease/helicase Cas3 n=1 Tax=Desulfocicer vacuolatum DSM 3385 TaxID=1121400 RepID=A0A1W2BZL9_9BACT|nr:CRISPR-associated helicase/endonuclease Cas3 [Desulfocicer vacuolatum]SMC78447.1 CRISPR-associated endonuclease/helicase Cas3 [Desulfocicer vacuolatum DSM 3385]